MPILQIKKQKYRDLSGGPVAKNTPCDEGMQVPSLVREQRSHIPRGNRAPRPQLERTGRNKSPMWCNWDPTQTK